MLKAALAAAAEPGPDSAKRIPSATWKRHHRRRLGGPRDEAVALYGRRGPASQPHQLANVASARALIYALTLGGAAFVVAMVALAVALLK